LQFWSFYCLPTLFFLINTFWTLKICSLGMCFMLVWLCCSGWNGSSGALCKVCCGQ